MTIRGGGGPRDASEPGRRREPMARPLGEVPPASAGSHRSEPSYGAEPSHGEPPRRTEPSNRAEPSYRAEPSHLAEPSSREEPARPPSGHAPTSRSGRGSATRRAGTVSAYDVARQRPRSGVGGLLRFAVFAGVASVLVLLLLATVLRPVTRGLVVGLADSNPGALGIPFVADFVREDLGSALTDPASDDPTVVDFTIESGETAAGIAARLVEAGLLRDERAFLLVAMERNLTGSLSAGDFLVRRNLTPDELVGTLLEARDPAVTIQFRTGLRLEQMTAYLEARPDEIATLQMKAADFLELVRNPPVSLLADHPWLDLPKGASLEGTLAAGAYRVLPDAGPVELVRMMLDRFGEQLGTARLGAIKDAKKSLHEVLSFASLVERETPLDDERALVAGVYQNRLDQGMLLQADPTVIWGVDTLELDKLTLARWPEYSFWNVPSAPLASIDFPAPIAGYQTYQQAGMIPGPIATPTMASIDAVLAPDTAKGYLYFVAIPESGGKHAFSKTYAQHLAKLKKYGYLQ